MPRVPRIERQVLTEPLPGVRLTARYTPESFGAGFGERLSDFGLVIKRKIDQANQIAATDADRMLGDFETNLLYGGRR